MLEAEVRQSSIALRTASGPFWFRKVSYCPAKEASARSSATADDRTATGPMPRTPSASATSRPGSPITTNPSGTLKPARFSSPRLAALPPTRSASAAPIDSSHTTAPSATVCGLSMAPLRLDANPVDEQIDHLCHLLPRGWLGLRSQKTIAEDEHHQQTGERPGRGANVKPIGNQLGFASSLESGDEDGTSHRRQGASKRRGQLGKAAALGDDNAEKRHLPRFQDPGEVVLAEIGQVVLELGAGTQAHRGWRIFEFRHRLGDQLSEHVCEQRGFGLVIAIERLLRDPGGRSDGVHAGLAETLVKKQLLRRSSDLLALGLLSLGGNHTVPYSLILIRPRSQASAGLSLSDGVRRSPRRHERPRLPPWPPWRCRTR